MTQWRRPPGGISWVFWKPDWRDLRAIAVFYVAIVGLYRLAFVVFTADVVAGLFFSFAAGLLLDRAPSARGYGMGFGDMTFLLGLGVVYAVAYRLVRNGLVLWPLLTPLGSFFANVEAGDIELPWASIMGFVDVAALMVTIIVIAHRHETGSSKKHRRRPRAEAPAPA